MNNLTVNRFQALLLIAIFAVAVNSCKHEPDEVSNPLNPGDTSNIASCDPDTAYFQNEVLPIFRSSCALSGCHDEETQEHDMILSSYEGIIASGHIIPGNANESEFIEVITEDDDEDRMPPPPLPRLSQDQITAIRDWINQGALNNYCENSCDSSKFSFSEIIQPLIFTNCKGCHNSGLSNGGVRLDSYEAIATVANDGRLFGTISHASGFIPMPFNGNKLPECNIDQVKKWIEAGSPNN